MEPKVPVEVEEDLKDWILRGTVRRFLQEDKLSMRKVGKPMCVRSGAIMSRVLVATVAAILLGGCTSESTTETGKEQPKAAAQSPEPAVGPASETTGDPSELALEEQKELEKLKREVEALRGEQAKREEEKEKAAALKAQEEAEKKAVEEAKRKAEEEARREAEEAAKLKAAEEAKKQAEAEAIRKKEQELREWGNRRFSSRELKDSLWKSMYWVSLSKEEVEAEIANIAAIQWGFSLDHLENTIALQASAPEGSEPFFAVLRAYASVRRTWGKTVRAKEGDWAKLAFSKRGLSGDLLLHFFKEHLFEDSVEWLTFVKQFRKKPPEGRVDYSDELYFRRAAFQSG